MSGTAVMESSCRPRLPHPKSSYRTDRRHGWSGTLVRGSDQIRRRCLDPKLRSAWTRTKLEGCGPQPSGCGSTSRTKQLAISSVRLGSQGAVSGAAVRHFLRRPLLEAGCGLGESGGHGGRRRVGQAALERATDALHERFDSGGRDGLSAATRCRSSPTSQGRARVSAALNSMKTTMIDLRMQLVQEQ
jgi:hypothetical protein